ncbi:MAG: S4 domain-containing protein [Pseudomonadota bacterium]
MTRDCVAGTAERLDKWLWQARFFKSRSLAAKAVAERRIRVNQEVVTKTHHRVREGDVLTFAQSGGAWIRVVRIRGFAATRGPATLARTLYDDLRAPSAALVGAERPTEWAGAAG